MIAALFVDPKGAYAGIPDVEVWDEARDARLYAGPHPVVAHPPCSRWCRLAGLVEARWGHKRGDDGGCFRSALVSVRRWGGVLEHPAWSDAFPAHGLPTPPTHGGWQMTIDGGAVCHIEQGRYGHPAKKATWLYAHGVDLPSLQWGTIPDSEGAGPATAYVSGATMHQAQRENARTWVSWCGNHVRNGEPRRRLSKREAKATPLAFRDVLLDMARSAHPYRVGIAPAESVPRTSAEPLHLVVARSSKVER